MGKLHSLRRAIEKDPENWLINYEAKSQSYEVKSVDRTGKRPYAEEYDRVTGQWTKVFHGPFTFFPTKRNYYWTGRYKSFVRHVLKGLGYRTRR